MTNPNAKAKGGRSANKVSDDSSNGSSNNSSVTDNSAKALEEYDIQQMEALLHHSTQGLHILFDNESIARIMSKPIESSIASEDKLKQVQDILIQLINKKTYYEKMSYIQSLDSTNFEILVRTYFHIVENTIRTNSRLCH